MANAYKRYDLLDSRQALPGNMTEVPHPAMCLNPAHELTDFNPAADARYKLAIGQSLFDLPFDSDTRSWIVGFIESPRPAAMLQARRKDTDRALTLVARAGRYGSVTLCTTELHWSSALLNLLATNFGLTRAELAVAHLLVDGASAAQAARSRCTSIATVRTQIKALLCKTHCHGINEFVRLVLSLATFTEPDKSPDLYQI